MDNLPLYKQLRFRLAIYLVVLISIPLIFFLVKPLLTPVPGSCLILEEKYCKKVTLIRNPNDPNGVLAAYKIPSGTILFAPTDGFFSNTPTFFFRTVNMSAQEASNSSQFVKYQGATITKGSDRTSKTISNIYSFIYFKAYNGKYPAVIKKGEVIDTISDQTISFLGNYNLIFGITKRTLVEEKPIFESDIAQLKTILNIK